MKIFPGTFNPVTYGHLEIAKRGGADLIVCSVNEDKNEVWFTPEQMVELWGRLGYRAMTLQQYAAVHRSGDDVIMLRGIRNEGDADYELEVMKRNHREFGLTRFEYVWSESSVSGTQAREAACGFNLVAMSELMPPWSITYCLEKLFDGPVYMVAGPPGAGKSTWCSSKHNWIDAPHMTELGVTTDTPEIKAEDMVRNEYGERWLQMMGRNMRNAYEAGMRGSAYLEVPYGLKYGLHRFLGAKVLYFEEDHATLVKRNEERGTPGYIKFIGQFRDERNRVTAYKGEFDVQKELAWLTGHVGPQVLDGGALRPFDEVNARYPGVFSESTHRFIKHPDGGISIEKL